MNIIKEMRQRRDGGKDKRKGGERACAQPAALPEGLLGIRVSNIRTAAVGGVEM